MPKEAVKEMVNDVTDGSKKQSVDKVGKILNVVPNKKVAKKKKVDTTAPSPNLIADMLIAMANIMIIIPAVIYGVFIFISAGFKNGTESALKMYNEGTESSKKWAVK